MSVVISDRLLESSDRLLDAEPDERLTRLAQDGHAAAFAAIVRRYEGELQAQARRLTSDGRGEDAVQQAFLNAFAALQRGAEIRHLRGWLHHILRNEVVRARVPVDAPLEAAVAYGEPLEDTVQRRATAHATLAQLSALPDRQRDALLGTAVLGFPRAHVARTMGLSEGAVRQLVHRARLRLRQAAGALIPFPLFRLFGAARSGVDAAPDAALGAGAAASGGLAIKLGALVASGVVTTGIAVTRPSRRVTMSHHRCTAPGTTVSPRAPPRAPPERRGHRSRQVTPRSSPTACVWMSTGGPLRARRVVHSGGPGACRAPVRVVTAGRGRVVAATTAAATAGLQPDATTMTRGASAEARPNAGPRQPARALIPARRAATLPRFALSRGGTGRRAQAAQAAWKKAVSSAATSCG